MANARRIGEWIAGRFEVFDVFRGGMGLVYVVYDHKPGGGSPVLAIKTLRDEYLSDPQLVARFITECHTWIHLDSHPNLVRAYEVQVIDDEPCLLLELVTGGNLRSWIGTERLDLPRVLRMAIQFCQAMEHAMAHGLHCHRDIKPENLLVAEGGTLKVTDFGLAKVRADRDGEADFTPIPLDDDAVADLETGDVVEDASSSDETLIFRQLSERLHVEAPHSGPSELGPNAPTLIDPKVAHPAAMDCAPTMADVTRPDPEGVVRSVPRSWGEALRTQVGSFMGTGIYMSPEQYRDPRAVDMTGDQYSFGVVLFEMIVGSPPFRGPGLKRLKRQHSEEPPPPLVPFVPRKHRKVARTLERVVHRCLSKDPKDRFASFAALRQSLERILWRVTGQEPVRLAPQDRAARDHISRGISLGALGLLEEEQRSYEEAFQIKADCLSAWFNQAASFGSQGRLEEAIDSAHVALHLREDCVPALVNKGLALLGLRRLDEALRCFDQAIASEPCDLQPWRGRLLVYLILGDQHLARETYNRIRRLCPEGISLPELKWPGVERGHTLPLHALPWDRRIDDEAG